MKAAQTLPPHPRPRPGRRRHTHHQLLASSRIVLFSLVIVLLSICSTVHAADAGTRAFRSKIAEDKFKEVEIIFDRSPAPEPALYRRAEASSILAPANTFTGTATPAASTSSSSDSTPTSIESAPIDSSSPLPKPFDAGLGTNYTQPSCPTFLKSMLSNDTFTSCLPFSLLLQNSMSFFTTTKTLPAISNTLNASCNIVFPACSSLMSSFAINLRSSSACSQDYQRENPIVRQAYTGLISYDVQYRASCLHNEPAPAETNSNFCYANAVTNLSSPTDSYIYYLPLGIPLPASSMPTCSSCLKDTMGVYATAAANKSQPLSLSYVDAAKMVNQFCGPGFVNGTIPGVGASGTGESKATRLAGQGWVLWTSVVGATVVALGL